MGEPYVCYINDFFINWITLYDSDFAESKKQKYFLFQKSGTEKKWVGALKSIMQH